MNKNLLKVCNKNVAGYYDFLEQEIHFNNINECDIQIAQKEASKNNSTISLNAYKDITKVLPLMYHELTHWIDHSSTLWGLDLTKKTLKANSDIKDVESNGREIIQFLSYIRKINYPKYYTTPYDQHTDDSPWKFQYSMGRLFNNDGNISDRPIIFTRFNDPYDIPVIRVPFSVASVLEVSATYQEFNIKFSYLSSLNKDDKIVEGNLLQKEMTNFLYDKEVALYSVAAHCLANQLETPDIYSAFRISSIVARIALNFPKKQFDKIDLNLERYKAWGDGVDKIFSNPEDRGTLFFLIADNLSTSIKELTDDNLIKKEIFNLLQSWGCDNEEQFTKDLEVEIYDILNEIESFDSEYAKKIKEFFYENYSLCEKWGTQHRFHEIYCPQMYLSDGKDFTGPKKSKSIDLLKKLKLTSLFNDISSFSEGCI